jgi:hypothetical protein
MTDGNPLTPAAFQVLLALATGPGGRAHGYGIMGFVSEVTGGDGLAEELPGEDSRRRYYRITPAGRAAASREASLLRRLVAAAGDADLLARPESA